MTKQDRRTVSTRDIERWKEMYDGGKSIKVIAEEEERGPQTIKRWLLKEGISIRQRQMTVSFGERDGMVDQFLAGARPEEIAEDRNIQTVWRNLCYGLRQRIWDLTKVEE